MTCKTYIELSVEVTWSWDEEDVLIESVLIVQRDSKGGESNVTGIDILESLTKKQLDDIKEDCRAEWKTKLKEEE